MGQDYQAGFYSISERVRNSASRQRKAEKIIQALVRYAQHPLSSALCVDIGCSSGIITSTIASLFGTVLGLDYDEVALRATDSSACARVHFVRADAMCLPLGDNMVDVIICAQVYEHVPDDELLFQEIYRVLTPGGVVFFSGPNWLFPIEPHYFLPFLHWLPRRLANTYLRLAGQGDHYYERSRHLWGLRRLMHRFLIRDITLEVLQNFWLPELHGLEWIIYLPELRGLKWIIRNMPMAVWKILLPVFPNFNWILHKPMRQENGRIRCGSIGGGET